MIDRVALVGLPASGKSTVGQALADLMGWSCMDLDSQVEDEAGLCVADIFSRHGESLFRDMERCELAKAAGLKQLVLAPGGGCVELADNRHVLSAHFFTVWLDIEPALAWERSKGGDRPLLSDGGLQRMLELSRRRAPWYREVSRLRVSVGYKSPQELAKDIHGQIM